MKLPDFRGYELENQIYSTGSRLIVLWFSKTDRENKLWRQIQVTLVSARLSMANVEIMHGFPPLRSCEMSEITTNHGLRIKFLVRFETGEISFESEDIACAEYSRKVQIRSGFE